MGPVVVLIALCRVSGVLFAAVVKDVKLGDSITLPCIDRDHEDTPVEHLDVQWWLGQEPVIRRDRGRISHGISYRNRTELPAEGSSRGDFSMIITHTQHGDSGVYQCVIRRENQEETLGEVQLRVKAPRSSSAVFVKVGEEAILPCFGRVDWFSSEAELVRWIRGDQLVLQWEKGSLYVDPQFVDRVSLSKDGILKDDLSLVLKNTLHEDQGLYLCYFVNHQGIRNGARVNLTVADHLTHVEAGFGSSVLLPLHTASAVSVWFLPDGENSTVQVCEVEKDQLKCKAADTHRTVLHTLHTIHNTSRKLVNLSMVDSGMLSVMERKSQRTVSVLFLRVFTTPAPTPVPPPAVNSGISEITTMVILVMLSLITLHLVISWVKRVIMCILQRRPCSTEKREAALHQNLRNTAISELFTTDDEQPAMSVIV